MAENKTSTGARVTVSQGVEGGESDPLSVIKGIVTGMRNLEAPLRTAVGRARDQGRSWQEIADVLGVSRQAAWERYRDTEQDPISAVAGSLGDLGMSTDEMRRRSRQEEAESEERRYGDPPP